MDHERSDAEQDRFQDDPDRRAAESGYPEEQPSDAVPDDAPGARDREQGGGPPLTRESDRGDEPGASQGAAGEGTQSTGNPRSAG